MLVSLEIPPVLNVSNHPILLSTTALHLADLGPRRDRRALDDGDPSMVPWLGDNYSFSYLLRSIDCHTIHTISMLLRVPGYTILQRHNIINYTTAFALGVSQHHDWWDGVIYLSIWACFSSHLLHTTALAAGESAILGWRAGASFVAMPCVVHTHGPCIHQSMSKHPSLISSYYAQA